MLSQVHKIIIAALIVSIGLNYLLLQKWWQYKQKYNEAIALQERLLDYKRKDTKLSDKVKEAQKEVADDLEGFKNVIDRLFEK